ncbi:translocation/assembly module TamB domain-containing protein [Marinobacter sp.]|uniref:translocation/assembly module TamB domain-containing protein n=1 Tax=Marinobacter sp. TaxID=50741 RepID=UPI0035691E6B
MSRASRLLTRAFKWLLVTLLIVLLLLVIVVGALLAALRSDTGTAWVLEQIPGLTTEQASGSLLGQWQAAQLSWSGYGVQVHAEEPVIDWSPTCLFRKTFCLDRLEVASLDVTRLPDGMAEDDETSGPVQLPEVSLPVSLDIGAVDVGIFRFNDTLIWDRLTLQGGGSGADFHIRELDLTREDVSLAVSGRVETRGDWPLALDVDLTLPPPEGDQWRIAGQLRGSVRDLRADLASSGYLDGDLQAEMAPLAPGLPASAEFRSDAFHALDTLPETLTLQDWQLNAGGNLTDGYRINARAQLPGQRGPVDLDLSALVTAREASDVQLNLTGPSAEGDGQAGLNLDGAVDWADELAVRASVNMGAFAWYDLLPDMTPPPVTITALQAEGEYRNGEYSAIVDLDASGPMGDATLDSRVKGDLEKVRLEELTMTTGGGRLQGEAEVGFAQALSWQGEFLLEQFDPGYWVPQASASINGSVTSRGRLDDEGQPEFTAAWDLEGQWQEAPLTSRGELKAADRQWQIPEVMATIGDNRLALTGQLQDPLGETPAVDIEGDLDFPQPEVLHPELAGSLRAEFAVNGPLMTPAGTLEASGEGLAWQNQLSISDLTLSARLDENQALEATVAASAIQAAGQTIEQVEADLSGTLDDHRLNLAVQHPQAVLETTLAGNWAAEEGGQWNGQLAEGQVHLPEPDQTWRLEAPADLNWRNQTLTLGAHCWRWQDSTLCAGEQPLLPDTELDLEISNLPASALSPLLPETIRWEARIDGSLVLALGGEGPTGQVQLSAGPGEVEVVLDEDWETLSYRTLTLSADLTPQQADVALRLDGDGLGALSVDLTVDPNAPDRPASGTFSLSDFDLAMVGSLLNMEEVSGLVEGSGTLEGPLLAPRVNGELVLSDGRVIDPMVPIPVSDLNLRLAFNGKRATLEGGWQSNGTGRGEIGGALDWEDTPVLTLVLEGDQLPLNYEPYAQLEVSPDLELRFVDGDLAITGRVAVPSGQIEVRELPEQAVSVSDDEVIVGREPEPPPVRSMNMDVTVVVGEDRVSFEGFGVTGDLEGELRIGNNMDTRGALQLVKGRYEAFGQELDLRRARLVFVGSVGEPYLDIEAVRRVDNVVAGIRLSGPASEPQTDVFSEPPMAQDQALSYVILGRPLQSQGDQGQVSRAALSLGLNRASGLTRGIGEAFGIQDLTLEAEGSGEDSAVVASGYLTEDLSLRYGVGLFEPITTVALRYDLGRYFYLEAASGLASSLDIFYTRDF